MLLHPQSAAQATQVIEKRLLVSRIAQRGMARSLTHNVSNQLPAELTTSLVLHTDIKPPSAWRANCIWLLCGEKGWIAERLSSTFASIAIEAESLQILCYCWTSI